MTFLGMNDLLWLDLLWGPVFFAVALRLARGKW